MFSNMSRSLFILASIFAISLAVPMAKLNEEVKSAAPVEVQEQQETPPEVQKQEVQEHEKQPEQQQKNEKQEEPDQPAQEAAPETGDVKGELKENDVGDGKKEKEESKESEAPHKENEAPPAEKKEPEKKFENHGPADYGYEEHDEDYNDDERLYADQEDEFDDSEKDQKDDFDAEYQRYIKELTKDLEEDHDKRANLIKVLSEMESNKPNAMQKDEKVVLEIAREIQHREDARSRLEEQQRELVEHQRRTAVHAQLREEGIESKADAFDFADEDNKLFLEPNVDTGKLMDLVHKRADKLGEIDHERRRAFIQHEMIRLLEFKEKVEQLTDPNEKLKLVQLHDQATAFLNHTKGHEPAQKAQLEEVWEEDGLDKDAFDPKTLFKMHDINGDGILDIKELEALFFKEASELHNGTDDPMIVREEMARMREFTLKKADQNGDDMIDLDEWQKLTNSDTFDQDKEWEPVNPENEITDKQLENFKKLKEKLDKTKHQEQDPQMMKAAKHLKRKLKMKQHREEKRKQMAEEKMRKMEEKRKEHAEAVRKQRTR
eukprot:m.332093 g.332093  ORF g.332093 m.332093 type:complete len:548 (-) comp16877_c0_seq1:1645-3288(-)